MATLTDKYELRARAVEAVARNGWVTIPKAAAMLGLHHQTLRKYVQQGNVNSIWVGTRQVLTLEEVERLQSKGMGHPDIQPEANLGEG